jgi:hypothetical protein
LIRFENQPALHRVSVHVAQLLDAFVLSRDDEIVKAALPDVAGGEGGVPETRRSIVVSGAPAAEKAAGEACFKACMTTEGLARSGSLTSKWMCSGMTTYPTRTNW